MLKTGLPSYFGCFRWKGLVSSQGCDPASCLVTAKASAQVHVQSTYLLHLSGHINRGEEAGWK